MDWPMSFPGDIQFAVNYSAASAALLRNGSIRFDRFKCPAWPDLIAAAQATHPLYVHFPLIAGFGTGDVLDAETGRPADWAKVERLLAQTNTPLVNVHLSASAAEYPDLPPDTEDPAHIAIVVERLLTDLVAVVRRFGADRVVAENDPANAGDWLRPAFLPSVISQVIREAGCGLLLDLAHVRLSAEALGMTPEAYASALPVERIREIHVTGVQRVEGHWVERMQRAGVPAERIASIAGKRFDHLPLTAADWLFFEWAMGQIRSGKWSSPWVVTFEYGGVGSLWGAITDAELLQEQVPRLYQVVKRE
jgi:hypothetical protein